MHHFTCFSRKIDIKKRRLLKTGGVCICAAECLLVHDLVETDLDSGTDYKQRTGFITVDITELIG